jgi:hypothetical protein
MRFPIASSVVALGWGMMGWLLGCAWARTDAITEFISLVTDGFRVLPTIMCHLTYMAQGFGQLLIQLRIKLLRILQQMKIIIKQHTTQLRHTGTDNFILFTGTSYFTVVFALFLNKWQQNVGFVRKMSIIWTHK